MKYKIITSYDKKKLSKKVNKKLASGWILKGGMTCIAIRHEYEYIWCQAMALEED